MTEYELEPTIHYTDAEKIRRLTAWHESEKAEIVTLRAEIARLREDARLADMAWKDNQAALRAQAAQIVILKAALNEIGELHHDRAHHSGTYEACQFITCTTAKNSTNGSLAE